MCLGFKSGAHTDPLSYDGRRKIFQFYFVFIYNHPGNSNVQFYNELYQFLNVIGKDKPFILIGDFNIDFNNEKNTQGLSELEQKYGFRPLFMNKPTHLKGNQLDWCFLNFDLDEIKIEYFVYQAWFTDHNPIRLDFFFE